MTPNCRNVAEAMGKYKSRKGGCFLNTKTVGREVLKEEGRLFISNDLGGVRSIDIPVDFGKAFVRLTSGVEVVVTARTGSASYFKGRSFLVDHFLKDKYSGGWLLALVTAHGLLFVRIWDTNLYESFFSEGVLSQRR